MIPDNVARSIFDACVIERRQPPGHDVQAIRDARNAGLVFVVTRRHPRGRVLRVSFALSESEIEDTTSMLIGGALARHFDAALDRLDLAEALDAGGRVRIDNDEDEANVERAALVLMDAVERYRKGKR